MKLLFYKANGGIFDKIIRLATRSNYSHVEILISDIIDGKCNVLGSSPRDGGVRIKTINFNPEHWDVVEVNNFNFNERHHFAISQINKKYDWLGILLSQVFCLRINSESKWFCSEYVAKILELPNASLYSPGDLYLIIKYMNERVNYNAI